MDGLILALTMSLAGMEGNLEPSRTILEPAPFPLEMSLYGAETAIEDPALAGLAPGRFPNVCVAVELPPYAELAGMEKVARSAAFDDPQVLPFRAAGPAATPVVGLGWLKDWSQR